MHGTNEDTTQDDPQKYRYPTEYSCHYWPYDWGGTGDGGKVVTHQNRSPGRDIVYIIAHSMSRGFSFGINSPQFFDYKRAIEYISDNEGNYSNNY
ncbi:hypothetical protein ES703_36754 [subsurface metagenome]